MKEKRSLALDINKGIAIFLVYLGHSFLYYPISVTELSEVCNVVAKSIVSFNMPLFFIISGFLFWKPKRTTGEIIQNKFKRLMYPYLFVMGVIFLSKLFLPASLSYHKFSGWQYLNDILLFGGERWFVYVLFVVFCIVAVFKNFLKEWTILLLMGLSILLTLLNVMPHWLLIDNAIWYLFFVFLGCLYKEHNKMVDRYLHRYYFLVYLAFVICNIIVVRDFSKIPFLQKFVLPITGSAACFVISQQLENLQLLRSDNIGLRYLRYAGRYSLQFYMLSFAFPFIRYGVVNVIHLTNPYLIVVSVMILQLISITILIEVTKRIKILKVPLGY